MITMRQGESYRIYLNLSQNDSVLTPDMIEDLKICIGDTFSKTWKQGGVAFDETQSRWLIFPTQRETLNMREGKSKISCHVKYPDSSVIITEIDILQVLKACCKEVF